MLKLKKTPNLTELAYSTIKQSLLAGSFEELSRLTEESLSAELGISKSPVREALNRLEAEGLVCIEARRGAYVRRFSAKEIADLYDLRGTLEVHAVELAIVTPKLLSNLQTSINRTKKFLKSAQRVRHIEEDMRFHALIAGATGNQELYKVLENLQQKSLLCRIKSFGLSASTAPVAHTNIYQALKKGDKRQAQAAMREHIALVCERLLASFEESSQSLASSGSIHASL